MCIPFNSTVETKINSVGKISTYEGVRHHVTMLHSVGPMGTVTEGCSLSWLRIFLHKSTVIQPVKKFHAFCGTRSYITVFTIIHNLSIKVKGKVVPVLN
jgi:hypothetical protein